MAIWIPCQVTQFAEHPVEFLLMSAFYSQFSMKNQRYLSERILFSFFYLGIDLGIEHLI